MATCGFRLAIVAAVAWPAIFSGCIGFQEEEARPFTIPSPGRGADWAYETFGNELHYRLGTPVSAMNRDGQYVTMVPLSIQGAGIENKPDGRLLVEKQGGRIVQFNNTRYDQEFNLWAGATHFIVPSSDEFFAFSPFLLLPFAGLEIRPRESLETNWDRMTIRLTFMHWAGDTAHVRMENRFDRMEESGDWERQAAVLDARIRSGGFLPAWIGIEGEAVHRLIRYEHRDNEPIFAAARSASIGTRNFERGDWIGATPPDGTGPMWFSWHEAVEAARGHALVEQFFRETPDAHVCSGALVAGPTTMPLPDLGSQSVWEMGICSDRRILNVRVEKSHSAVTGTQYDVQVGRTSEGPTNFLSPDARPGQIMTLSAAIGELGKRFGMGSNYAMQFKMDLPVTKERHHASDHIDGWLADTIMYAFSRDMRGFQRDTFISAIDGGVVAERIGRIEIGFGNDASGAA